MPGADVVIVGAGPAGLSTAGALRRLGVDAVVLERDDEVGARWASRYDGLRLHTVRRFSGLAHHPLPRTLPRYVSKDDYAAYLRAYAEHHELDIRLGQEVTAVRPAWEVETRAEQWHARAVVIATGRYGEPYMPEWAGYGGRVLHAHDYRSAAEFRDRRVLVVGLGNSGAEIAAELAAAGAARVAVSVRTPPPIARREILGVPTQLLGIALAGLPPQAVDRIGSLLRPDLSAHGIGRAGWTPFVARRPPVIDAGLVRQLDAGRIAVRPPVARLTETGAVFADGSAEAFDGVIAATGYRPVLPAGAEAPGVHLVGFRESVRGALYEINRESRRLARAIREELHPLDEERR